MTGDGGSRSGDQITYTCRRCGEHKTETVAHTHSFDSVVSDTPATCTNAEIIVLQCSCGAQATTTGQGALGHSLGTAACQSGSQIVYTCTRCGATRTEAAALPSQESSSSTSDSTPATRGSHPHRSAVQFGLGKLRFGEFQFREVQFGGFVLL